MEDPEFAVFWQLLGYHDAITPEIQRAALAAEVFWPCEIYYHAPADVRDGLIHALLSAEYSSAASNLMSCLAMQGDDKAMETLLELERNPRPWRKGLYVCLLYTSLHLRHGWLHKRFRPALLLFYRDSGLLLVCYFL